MKVVKNKKKLISEMDCASTLGGNNSIGGAVMNSDSYAPGDNRVPKILGLYSRKGKKKTNKFEEDAEEEEKDPHADDLNELIPHLDMVDFYANSKLNDLTEEDWKKISDSVDEDNINFYEAIRNYYKKKFGEKVSFNEVDDFFNKYYAYGARPLGVRP